MKNYISFLLLLTSFCVFSQTKKPDGPYKESHSNGQLKREGFYKNDKKIGVWKEYYDNGQLSKVYVLDNNGKNTGVKRDYSKEGILLIETKQDLDSKLITNEYDDEGKLLAVYELLPNEGKEGFKWQGKYQQFYKSGAIKISSFYADNELNGLWELFDETGNKIWEVEYLKGYKEGYYKQFYNNNEIKVFGFCKLGKKEGEEKHYDFGNKLLNILIYRKNQLKKFDNQDSLNEVVIPDGIVNKPPVFPGCDDALSYTDISKCFSDKITEHITKSFNVNCIDTKGTIVKVKISYTFKINENGQITNITTASEYPEAIIEAKRVLSTLPKIQPSLKRGEHKTSTHSSKIIFMAGVNAK